jgi:hypothetical protein
MLIIPTHYNGIKYRSRSEARWAVVFDALGWNYEYEIEGYSLSTGRYLPDFYLPQHRAFFEVKGEKPNRREKKLADELAMATEKIVIVSHGPPNPRRDEWAEDLSIFIPERVDDVRYADWQEGGFVSGRFSYHPKCSLNLGNLTYLECFKDVTWQTAFTRAANHRFGVFG